MPFVPVPDCVRAKFEGRVDGQQVINTLYFRHTTGPISMSDMNALNVALSTWYGGLIIPNLNVAYSGVRVTCQGLTNANGLVTEQSLAGNDGLITGEALPNNCTMAVSFRTGSAGRSRRGRNYVPVLSDSEVTGNFIDTAFAEAIVDGYGELIFPGTSLPGGWIWVVVSTITNGEPRVEGEFHEVFSVLVTDLVVDSQRRRLPGRGR